MRIYFGTVIRNAPVNLGGELVALDWTTKSVLHRVPVRPEAPDLSHDANPRGNGRGCRGVILSRNFVIAANYHSLLFFDRDLAPQKILSHKMMAGLHEICPGADNTIWVTSTALDCLLQFDLESGDLRRSYSPREMPELQQQLKLQPFVVDWHADNRERYLNRNINEDSSHLHLNAVARWRGDVYGLFNKFGVIANLSAGEVVIQDESLRGAHNLHINEQGVAISNDTLGRGVVLFDLANKKIIDRIEILKFEWVRALMSRAQRSVRVRSALARLKLLGTAPGRSLFVRGLAVDNSRLFIGMSPGSIIEIDLHSRELVDAYQYSSDINHCVHGLCLLPGS